MSTYAPIAPEALILLLKKNGFHAEMEDERNWGMARIDDLEPVIVPKHGQLVASEIVGDICKRLGLSIRQYQDLARECCDEASVPFPYQPSQN
jgi:hypothetical protein